MGQVGRAALVVAMTVAAMPAAAAELSLKSPDGAVEVVVNADGVAQPTYQVRYNGRAVLAPSNLGLQFEAYQKLAEGLAITSQKRAQGVDRYDLPAAKVSKVEDRYNELVVGFQEAAGQQRRLEITFRAYDEGVAFRYRLPAQPAVTDLRLFSETTQFAFPADYDCWGLNLGKFGSSHEGEYDRFKASAIRGHNLFELPVVCRTGVADTAVAFAEADLRNYAGMYLTARETAELGMEIRLSPRLDDPTVAVKGPVTGNGVESPWRVVMLADSPAKLIESTLMTSLNPAADRDFSWVKPGKSAWDWWNGPTLSTVPNAGMNDATIKAYIDFAAQNGLEYMLIDDGWYMNSGAGGRLLPGADPYRTVPAIDLPGLIRYAADRKVDIWVWMHWALLDRDMDRILPHYAKMGVKGFKVDFMDRDDQQMVAFYHRLARATADNRLMLDLHGAYRPTGMIRTWPNYITQEGVLGAEYNKWTRRITATHNVTLPFTRGLLGPYDYTPGGFRNATPGTFRIEPSTPMVQTTRGQALAMYVVFDSPFQGVSDSPDQYRNASGMDFIRAVPAAWDETRALAGEIGEHVVIARRKGRDWYVGAMTNEAARQVQVPLDFLGRGRFRATIWQDGAAVTEVASTERTVTAADFVSLAMAASGGGVVRLTPLD